MANRKRNVAYVDQEEPAFLRQFKQRVGYKEAPGVDAKTPNFDDSDEDRPEADDEKPQVVVLKKGDLTAAEAEAAFGGTNEGTTAAEEDTDRKIVFKKPVKRQGEASSDLNISSKKCKDSESEKSEKSDKLKKKLKDKNKKIKNTKLLSFDAEEED